MSASQLLRILQTLPACAKNEISSFNPDELEANMNENESPKHTNPLSNFWNNPELESSIFDNDFTNNHEDEKFRKSLALYIPSDLLENTTGFHINKNTTECELPEFLVCYKESGFHVVKDICVDKNNSHEVHVNGDDDMIEVNLDTEFLKRNYGPDGLMRNGEEMFSSANLPDDVSKEKPVSNSMLFLQQDRSTISLEFTESSNNGSADVDQKPVQNCVEEYPKRRLVGSETEKLVKSDETANILNESKMEASGNVGIGEGMSSFSMAGVISGLINRSGPIAFSGNISLRSDSSMTSTRSFAFPTLQGEWNSSPVRMVKAERRRLQKLRGWRLGLACCRF